MILQGFYRVLSGSLKPWNGNATGLSAKAMNGTSYINLQWQQPFNGFKNTNSTAFSYDYYSYFFIGSGSTPPTYNDYNMESLIPNSDISQITTKIDTMNIETNLVGVAKTITNISASPITVSETGIACQIYGVNSAILITRSLLPTPITLQPNDIYTFTEYIKIDL